jgi:hypothetical protein
LEDHDVYNEGYDAMPAEVAMSKPSLRRQLEADLKLYVTKRLPF